MAGMNMRFMNRYKADMKEMFSRDEPDGIYLVPDDEQLPALHALLIGPDDTPYEGGLFYFYIKLPSTYPITSPTVKLMTTDSGAVRFNPNLYACGKVCLSILGTWAGPSWTAVMTIHSVLLSIRSLMCEKPYFNEPGFESSTNSAHGKAASDQYNREVRRNTLRAAIYKMLQMDNSDSKNMPEVLKYIARRYFLDNYDKYKAMFQKNLSTPGLLKAGPETTEYATYVQKCDEMKKSLRSDEETAMCTQLFDSLRTRFAPPEVPVDTDETSEIADLFRYNLDDEPDSVQVPAKAPDVIEIDDD